MADGKAKKPTYLESRTFLSLLPDNSGDMEQVIAGGLPADDAADNSSKSCRVEPYKSRSTVYTTSVNNCFRELVCCRALMNTAQALLPFRCRKGWP
jgi:hypothetical protein